MPDPTNPDLTPANPTAKLSMDDIMNEVTNLKNIVADLTKQLKDVTQERDEANGVLSAQLRASLISKARHLTNIPDVTLQKMSVDELEQTVTLAQQLKTPMKSIRFSADADEASGIINLYAKDWKKE